MGDLTETTAQHDTGVEAYVRLRMMGVHVAHHVGGKRVRGGDRPNRAELHRVLAGLGLLRGDVTDVCWYTARRPVARVEFSTGEPVVLKWRDPAEPDNDNEMWALSMLRGVPLPSTLEAALPRVLASAPDGRVHAFEYVAGADPWVRAEMTPEHLSTLARCLAELHTLPVTGPPDRRLRFPFPSLARLTPAEYARGYGADFDDYTAAMQAIDSELGELRDAWTSDAYVHFDLRDDNVLLGADSRLALLDWETAGFGDPCHDVGSVIGQLLAHHAPALRTGADPKALDRALGSAGRFLHAYGERAGADPAAMRRSLRFAGVFLLLNCLGRLEKVGSLGRIGHLYLLIGSNLVRRPEPALTAALAGAGA